MATKYHYDRYGKEVAYADDGRILYDPHGHELGYIEGRQICDRYGHETGYIENGIIYDNYGHEIGYVGN